jgi:hypothetical protein
MLGREDRQASIEFDGQITRLLISDITLCPDLTDIGMPLSAARRLYPREQPPLAIGVLLV